MKRNKANLPRKVGSETNYHLLNALDAVLSLQTINNMKIFTFKQGRNEVRWHSGHEASLSPACSKLSFGSKCTVLKEVLVILLVLFGASRSDLAPP